MHGKGEGSVVGALDITAKGTYRSIKLPAVYFNQSVIRKRFNPFRGDAVLTS